MAFQVTLGNFGFAASATVSIVDLATPATGVARVYKWWVASSATSAGTATSAIRVQVGLFSLAVGTHTAITPDKFDGADANIASQVTAGVGATVEGAGAPVSPSYEEHWLPLTQSELIVWEPIARVVPPSSFWRIRLISPAGIGSTTVSAGVAWTE